MLVNICMKFHEGTFNGFWVTERTRPYRKIYYFQFQRAITPKIHNPELRLLRSARRLMLLYICVQFHENISNGFLVTERTRFCDRQTDGQTDRRPGQKQYVSQPYEGRHNYRLTECEHGSSKMKIISLFDQQTADKHSLFEIGHEGVCVMWSALWIRFPLSISEELDHALSIYFLRIS